MQDMNAWLEPSYGGMHCCILHLALEATANIYITNREIFFTYTDNVMFLQEDSSISKLTGKRKSAFKVSANDNNIFK